MNLKRFFLSVAALYCGEHQLYTYYFFLRKHRDGMLSLRIYLRKPHFFA